MPGRFLEIPVFLGDYFIMPNPVQTLFGFRVYNNYNYNIIIIIIKHI